MRAKKFTQKQLRRGVPVRAKVRIYSELPVGTPGFIVEVDCWGPQVRFRPLGKKKLTYPIDCTWADIELAK